MRSSVALSLLFLLPSIRAAALPQLVGDELESTSSSQKRDALGNLTPRSPESGLLNKDSKDESLVKADASTIDDPSLGHSLNLERDISARDPQGTTSNPNSASLPSSADDDQEIDALDEEFSKMSEDGPSGIDLMMEDDSKVEHHLHHNGSHHNGTHHHHHKGNGTHPAWNATDYHHHHHHNETWGPMPTGTGAWFPTGTGWMPSGTGRPRHHRKVPSAAYAGYRGPMS